MRGTRRGALRRAGRRRFIPACAGNTPRSRHTRSPPAVHPRLCGEHLTPPDFVDASSGSSPPVRGTLVALQRAARQSRFIPACAGNTSRVGRAGGKIAVHPRLCGEHARDHRNSRKRCGSSPPVRGTPPKRHAPKPSARFIPACAGNTHHRPAAPRRRSVHPRLCGEHACVGRPSNSFHGSSPPVRGTLGVPNAAPLRRRFIPACAGNTTLHRQPDDRSAVHPRLCGEHPMTRVTCCWFIGSSPPVRGTLRYRVSQCRRGRFIPACAGNTTRRPLPRHVEPVHPRLCGEHSRSQVDFHSRPGSSPPVRGTPHPD